MKLRVANKIWKRMEERDYRDSTLSRAFRRRDKAKSTKELDRYWNGLMETIGWEGQLDLVMTMQLRDLEERFASAADQRGREGE